MNRNYRPPELTETAGGVNEGNYTPSEPELYLNLGAEWDVPFLTGITLTGRVMHTSKQFINAANTRISRIGRDWASVCAICSLCTPIR